MTNIAFIGKMRHGKTTAAMHLVKNYGYERHSFANPVKQMGCVMLEAAGEFLINQGNDNGEATLDMTLPKLEAYKTHPAIRAFLQNVGGDLGRGFYGPQSLWVDMLLRNLPTTANVVIDDCRYLNEAEALKERGFVFVRVIRERNSWQKDMDENYSTADESAQLWDMLNHPSETELRLYDVHWKLDGARTATELYKQVDDLMTYLT